MKYRYIRTERRRIREEDIPEGEHYGGRMAMVTMMRFSRNPRPTRYYPLYNNNLRPSFVLWRYSSCEYVSLVGPGYMHEYMTRTFMAIDTRLDHKGDLLRRIEGHLLPAWSARDDRASGSAHQTSSH
ncbi:hypothetical protein Scep_025911 [Stephania cephalantha]|uniref:Uncharacterized protein n=1 Tax=Stephania cephalantha TaxID=152367 RepID=A0AAP0EPD2_9MAGN